MPPRRPTPRAPSAPPGGAAAVPGGRAAHACAAAILASIAACSDPAPGPGTPPADPRAPRVTLVGLPAGDTLHRRSIEVRARVDTTGRLLAVALVVDAGTPAQATSAYPAIDASDTSDVWHLWYDAALPNGRHTLTVRAVDDSGRVGEATVTRVFHAPDAPYSVAPLPALGGDADATAINGRGEVAGWAETTAGVRRPVVWRDGTLHQLPFPEGVPGQATRINERGDVMGQNADHARPRPGSRNHGLQPLVWRADGQIVELGPFSRPSELPGAPDVVCCSVAGDLNDRGLALAYTSHSGIALVDIATGAHAFFVGTAMASAGLLNDAGQALGGALLSGRTFVLVPMTLGPGAPPLDVRLPSVLGTPFGCARICQTSALALGDGGEVLASMDGHPALSQPDSAGYFLYEYLGPHVRTPTMSRDGRVIVGVDAADSTVWLMRAADRRPVRVAPAGGPWRIDRVGAVNASGAVVGHARNPATGWAGAVLLTPAR